MTTPHQPTPATPLCICPACHRFTGMGSPSTVGVHYRDGFLCSGSGGWTSSVEPVEDPTPPPPPQTPARGEGVHARTASTGGTDCAACLPGMADDRHCTKDSTCPRITPAPSGGVHPEEGVPAGGARTTSAGTGRMDCMGCVQMHDHVYCASTSSCLGTQPTTQGQDTQCALCWTGDHGLCTGARCRCTHLVCAPRRQGG